MAAKKVIEKTLELNICAEILGMVRVRSPHSLFSGLTQKAEHQQGVDAFLQDFHPRTRVFAFQFKAPANREEYPNCDILSPCRTNYEFRFNLERLQYESLLNLAAIGPSSVYYVFPYFCCRPKLIRTCPILLNRTWFWHVNPNDAWMELGTLFARHHFKTAKCIDDRLTFAAVHHLFDLISGHDFNSILKCGIPIQDFAMWLFNESEYYNELGRIGRERRRIGGTQFLFVE